MGIEQLIESRLSQIERQENLKILYAAEAKSRAWGFASDDSDFDVRFIYIRPRNEYLKLNAHQDFIEKPVDAALDINGWDLTKTLKALKTSDPWLYEWFSSPICYRCTDFLRRIQPLLEGYFNPRSVMTFYHDLADKDYQNTRGHDKICPKDYFYIMRPLLACGYVQHTKEPAPILFQDLMEFGLSLPLHEKVTQLLKTKHDLPEDALIPRIPELDKWIEREFRRLTHLLARQPEKGSHGWDLLNHFFLNELELL